MLLGNWYGYMYDADLHAFFIGFVFSMIFAHVPIIFPGVAGYTFKPYSPYLYIWGALLQASMLLRFSADVLDQGELRMWAGMLNGITMLGFFLHIALLSRKEMITLRDHKKTACVF